MKMEYYPLHLSQLDVYIDQLVNIDSPHYNTGGYIRLFGNLNKEVLKEAARSVPLVFDAFRIRIDLQEPVPCFFVEENYAQFDIEEIDFSKTANPSNTAHRWMQERFNSPFVLRRDHQPFEQALLRISDDEHWFYNKYHHLITDGYGFTVWAKYIAQKYSSLLRADGQKFAYPSYLEAAIKSSFYRDSERYAKEGEYWLSKIGHVPTRLLHNHSQVSDINEKRSGTHSLFLSEYQREELEKLQEVTNCSLQQLTIAALLIYFGKTTVQQELVFGIPLHKRVGKNDRNTFGTFSGVIPFKGGYKPECTLIDLLKEVKLTQKEDYRHKNYLMSDLNSGLRDGAASTKLIEVVINYELLDFKLDFGDSLQASIHHLMSEYETTPLNFCWRDFGPQQPLELRLDFQLQFCLQKEAELLSERLLFILQQFHSHLHQPVRQILVVPDQERKLIVESFNATEVVYPQNKTVVDLFEEQAMRNPDQTAVKFGEDVLSYAELNARANQLAHYLKDLGVSQGDMVPVCVERGLNLVIALLGILKTGAAYVPIDTNYPGERIAFMVREIKPSTIVTTSSARRIVPNVSIIVEVDGDWDLISLEASDNIKLSILPDHLMYVIFTSGSTGIPKGAGVYHKSAVNLLQWYIREFSITSHDCNMVMSSVGFDLTQKNIWGTLLAGGTITMPQMDYYDVPRIVQCIREHKVTIVNCAPSAFYPVVAESNSFDDIASMRLLVLGGEPIRLKLLSNWIFHTDYKCEIVNSYGPTECTDISAFYRLKDPMQYMNHSMPIGRPNDNVKLYIVNNGNELMPVGTVGEVCVGGESVGAGYVNDKELTEQKFSVNPFGYGRLYRTGDLGRWLPDGNVEYLGRVDDQVKIRGYRIELSEIESALEQSPYVNEAVVLVKDAGEGDKRIVAYVVCPNGYFNKEGILSFLRARLPEYMVPSAFVEMDTMPLTPNGKIDKSALPEPEAKVTADYVAPRNEVESRLVKIWSEVLGIDAKSISVTDNFFSLGGHSLLGVNLMAQISKEFDVDFQITILFECPEIGLLASRLAKDIKADRDSIVVTINKGSNKVPFFCVPGAGGNVISFQALGRLLGEEQPFYSFQAPGLDGISATLKSVEEMADVYIKELQKMYADAPIVLGGYSFGASVAYEMVHQLQRRGLRVAKLIIFDAYDPKRLVGYNQWPAIVTEDEDASLIAMAEVFASLYGKKLSMTHDMLREKLLDEKFSIIQKTLSMTGIQVTQEQVKGFTEVCIANVNCHYDPRGYDKLNTPVILFKPEERVQLENEWYKRDTYSNAMGWDTVTTEEVKVYNVPGTHWTLLSLPHVNEIATYLREELNIEKNADVFVDEG